MTSYFQRIEQAQRRIEESVLRVKQHETSIMARVKQIQEIAEVTYQGVDWHTLLGELKKKEKNVEPSVNWGRDGF
jgi:hypothetical protein